MYGPDSASPRLFVNSVLGFRYLALNVSRSTFAASGARRAVQYAIDRGALADFMDLAANDNDLPPGVPGYGGDHLYPLAGPDSGTATALLGGDHPTAVFYVPDVPFALAVAGMIRANLESAGFQVTVTPIARSEYYGRLANPSEPYDLALAGWFADYPDAFDFLNLLLRSDSMNNYPHFQDPSFDAELDLAAGLLGNARISEYHRLDLEAMDQSPMVVLGNPHLYDFFSERTGCEIYQPTYGMDISALCLK